MSSWFCAANLILVFSLSGAAGAPVQDYRLRCLAGDSVVLPVSEVDPIVQIQFKPRNTSRTVEYIWHLDGDLMVHDIRNQERLSALSNGSYLLQNVTKEDEGEYSVRVSLRERLTDVVKLVVNAEMCPNPEENTSSPASTMELKVRDHKMALFAVCMCTTLALAGCCFLLRRKYGRPPLDIT